MTYLLTEGKMLPFLSNHEVTKMLHTRPMNIQIVSSLRLCERNNFRDILHFSNFSCTLSAVEARNIYTEFAAVLYNLRQHAKRERVEGQGEATGIVHVLM